MEYTNILWNFIKNELSCECQIIQDSLVIKGKFKSRVFEKMVSKFIKI